MQRRRTGVVALTLACLVLSGCQRVNSPAVRSTELPPSTSSSLEKSPTKLTSADTAQSPSSTTPRTSVASSHASSPQDPPAKPANAVPTCPSRLKATERSENPLPPVNGISDRLVPATPVRTALLCSYVGTNMDPIANQRLAASRILTSGLAEMVRDLRWLPPRINSQPVNCTAVGGPQTNYLLGLHLADGTTAWVAAAQDPNGCVQATNGTFTAFANIGSELAATMKTGQWPGRRPFPGDTCAGAGRYGQQSQLVPDGAVALDICHSAGGAFNTVAHVTTGFSAVVDALNAKATTTSTNSCAISAPGLMYNLAFRYATGPPVEIRYMKGCNPALDNSSLQATDNGNLVALLEALMPASEKTTPKPTSKSTTSTTAKSTG